MTNPYLADGDASIEGVLQAVWDRQLSRKPLLLVLVGSDLGMMESLTRYDRPLHGRPTREIVVDPLNVAELSELLELDPASAFDAYLMIGGFPQLARNWRSGRRLETFLRDELATSSSPLVTDALRVLDAELPTHSRSGAVLTAVSAGETGFNKIQARSGVSPSHLRETLTTLERRP